MDRFEVSTLRSYYGALLTQRQNDMLVMHYDEDLSFGEIANIVGISRQAVLDGINKGENIFASMNRNFALSKGQKMHAVIDTLSGVDDDRAKQCAQQLKLLLEE